MNRPRKRRARAAKDAPKPAPPSGGVCPVVGLGASAGGLDPLQRFFATVPPDSGMAFVVVQHLDPRHPTMLPELLGRGTAMLVEQAADGIPARPNQVYVIPPNAVLTMEAGVLRVTPPATEGLRMPIDALFHSLAEDQGHNAVCILFSGLGSDGTLGLRAVKAHGGMVMAQSPESAQHDAILRSAISTGLVDHVLPPEELADKLMEYATYLRSIRTERGPDATLPITGDELARICAHLRRTTGHDFSQYKTATLARRIQRRMLVLHTSTVSAYIEGLRRESTETELLFRDLLIGVTHFFRDPEAFEVLAREVVPRLLEDVADRPIRVWVPGCATGEEAYSIAILIRDELRRRDLRVPVQVFAGDIDEDALEIARHARYPEGIAQHVPRRVLERYFVHQDHAFHLTREIRDMCIFSAHSLIKDPPFSRLDLIVCRNVLIYMETDLQRHVASLFHYALRRGGFLFLGPSESLEGHPNLFRTVDRKHRVFQRVETMAQRPVPLPTMNPAGPVRSPVRSLPARGAPRGRPELVAKLERILLEQYGPAWVVINSQHQCVYFSPRTGQYLEAAAGAPSADVIEMARAGLRHELRAAIHKAIKTGDVVTHENVAVGTGAHTPRINLIVRPLPELGDEAGMLLVVFRERTTVTSRSKSPRKASASEVGQTLVDQLEGELRSTKDHLQSTLEEVETSNEELKSSNEELLSTNEELQSANEELQSSKEELQSVNEELETINAELNEKVSELDRARSDLENLFHGTQIPTLFLDPELRIKRFTSAATRVFHLVEADVERPLSDIASRFGGDLTADMQEVLRTLLPKERQLGLIDRSATFIVRMLPYLRSGKVADGLIVLFLDITQLSAAQEQHARLAAIVESSHDAIVGRTFDGTITSWNEAAVRMFGYSESEAVGSRVSIIVPPEQMGELEQIEAQLQRGDDVASFESVRLTKDGQRVAVWVAVSPVKDSSGAVIGSSAILRDLTDLKRMRGFEDESRRKDHFLATLSHELRGPLATLRICVDIIQAGSASAERAGEALRTADRQLEQLAVLVDQLLDASRIASGKVSLKRSDEDLVEIVRMTARDQQGALEEAGVHFDLHVPSRPLWVHVDPVRVSQILVNLLGNAAKFSAFGGQVTLGVRADAENKTAVISVRDEGVGIEPQLVPRLFQPFSQGNVAAEHGRAGLGLGLALVHGLAQAHGGAVEARSEGRGRGAEFIVRLPLIDRAARPPLTTARAAATGSPRRILVVEDSRDTAESLRARLEIAGHTVEVAGDGASALAKVLSFRPEVVLCDVGLPGTMDGHAVARTIRTDATYGAPYLVALSGYGLPEDKARALGAGFDIHVTKAGYPGALLKLIAEAPTR